MIEFKFSDFLYISDLFSAYRLMRRSEHWRPDQFRNYQAERLICLLKHCGEQVPYYESLFKHTGITTSALNSGNVFALFARLPLLDKDTLRNKSELFVARNASHYAPKAISTSGTTGTPLTVYWDRGSNVMELCSMQRFWRWAGFRIGQSFLDLRSRFFIDDDRHLVRKGKVIFIRNSKINALEFNSDLINEDTLAEYYKILLHYRPKLLRGHPQAIQKLALLLEEHGLTGWRPKVVTPTSEALYDFQKKEIERVWSAPVLDHYGLKEHNAFFAQCLQGGYHMFPEYGITEIVDDAGRPVAAGQEGWIVATGLHNYAQPLLRYHTRDRGIAAGEQTCACGRTLPLIQSVVGRIDDCLYTASGKRYSGLAFAFFDKKGLQKARLVQRDLETVDVQLVVTSEFNEQARQELLKMLQAKVNNEIQFNFLYQDDIIQDSPGKFKFVVCLCKPHV